MCASNLSDSSTVERPRILLAKPGLDGHNRGIRVVARALRDAGCEVIYMGIRTTPEEIAFAAAQENVDMIGLSILSGTHVPLCRQIREALEEMDAREIPILCGGIIPDDDHDALRSVGVRAVFTPGATLDTIIKTVWEIWRSEPITGYKHSDAK